jgi:hypothetical protein
MLGWSHVEISTGAAAVAADRRQRFAMTSTIVGFSQT